jgi:hypothetical protein
VGRAEEAGILQEENTSENKWNEEEPSMGNFEGKGGMKPMRINKIDSLLPLDIQTEYIS